MALTLICLQAAICSQRKNLQANVMSQNSLLGRLYSSLKFTHYLTQPESGALLTLFKPPGFGNFHKKNSSFQFKRLKRLGLEPSFQCKLQRNTWSSGWALARQHEPKWPQNYFTYDVSHKKSATPNQKIFFKCNLPDWPIRLSPWTAL